MLTAFALQAGVVSAVTLPVPISLPALLVAAVALTDGAGAGIAYGFGAGLVADLGSGHPAGILAITWMVIGMLCGLAADRASLRRDVLIATGVCTVGAALATLALAVLGYEGAGVGAVLRYTLPTFLGDAVLAAVVVPVVRRFLHADALQAPRAPGILLGVDS